MSDDESSLSDDSVEPFRNLFSMRVDKRKLPETQSPPLQSPTSLPLCASVGGSDSQSISLPYSPVSGIDRSTPDLNRGKVEILAELSGMSINDIVVFMKQHLEYNDMISLSSRALHMALDEQQSSNEIYSHTQTKLVILEVLSQYSDSSIVKAELIPSLTLVYGSGSNLLVAEGEAQHVNQWLSEDNAPNIRGYAIELGMQYASLGVLSIEEQIALCNSLLRVLDDADIHGLTCAVAAIEYLLLSDEVSVGVVDNIKLIYSVVNDNKRAVSHMKTDESFLKIYCNLLGQAICNDEFQSSLVSNDLDDTAAFLCSLLEIEICCTSQSRISSHVVAALACAVSSIKNFSSNQHSLSPAMLIPGKGAFSLSSTVSKTLASMTCTRKKLLNLSNTAKSVIIKKSHTTSTDHTDLNSTTERGTGEVLDVIRDSLDVEEGLLSVCSAKGMEELLLKLAATPGVLPQIAEICLLLMLKFRPTSSADLLEETNTTTPPSWPTSNIIKLVDVMSQHASNSTVVASAAACIYSVLSGNDQNWIHIFNANNQILTILLDTLGNGEVQEDSQQACLQGLLVIINSSGEAQKQMLQIESPGGVTHLLQRVKSAEHETDADVKKCFSLLHAAINQNSVSRLNIKNLLSHKLIDFLQNHMTGYPEALSLLRVLLCHPDVEVSQAAAQEVDMSLFIPFFVSNYPNKQLLKTLLLVIAQAVYVSSVVSEDASKHGLLDRVIQLASEKGTDTHWDIEIEYCCGYLLAVLAKEGDEKVVKRIAISGGADLIASSAKFQSASLSSEQKLLCLEMLPIVENAVPSRVSEITSLNEKINSLSEQVTNFESEKRSLEISYLEKIETVVTSEKTITEELSTTTKQLTELSSENNRLKTVEDSLSKDITSLKKTLADNETIKQTNNIDDVEAAHTEKITSLTEKVQMLETENNLLKEKQSNLPTEDSVKILTTKIDELTTENISLKEKTTPAVEKDDFEMQTEEVVDEAIQTKVKELLIENNILKQQLEAEGCDSRKREKPEDIISEYATPSDYTEAFVSGDDEIDDAVPLADDEISKLETLIETLKTTTDELTLENNYLKQQNEETITLKGTVDKLTSEIKLLNTTIDDLSTENNLIKQQLENNNNNNDQSEEVTSLLTEVEKLSSETKILNSAVGDLTLENSSLKELLESSQQQTQLQNQQLQANEKQVNQFQLNKSDEIAERDQKILNNEHTITDLQKSLTEVSKQFLSSSQNVATLTLEKEDFERKITTLQGSVESLQTLKQNNERDQRLKQSEVIDSYEQRITALELSHNHLENKSNELQLENTELRKASDKLTEIQNNMNSMNNEVRSAINRARESESAYQQLQEQQSADCTECLKVKTRLKAAYDVITRQGEELQLSSSTVRDPSDIEKEVLDNDIKKRMKQLKTDELEISKAKELLKSREKRIRKLEKKVRARDSGLQAPLESSPTTVSQVDSDNPKDVLNKRINAIRNQEIQLNKAQEDLLIREQKLRTREQLIQKGKPSPPIHYMNDHIPNMSFPVMIESYRTKRLEKEVQRMMNQIEEFNKTQSKHSKLILKQQVDYDLLVVIRNCPLGNSNKQNSGSVSIHHLLSELQQWWSALKSAWLPHYEQYLQERCSDLHSLLIHVADVLSNDARSSQKYFSTPTPPTVPHKQQSVYLEKVRPRTSAKGKRRSKQAFVSPTYSV